MRWRKMLYHTYKLYSPYGTVSIFHYKNTKTGDLINLETSEKRKGYGTILVNLAIAKAKKMKLKRLRVRVMDTEEANLFWKTFGIKNLAY